MNASPDALLSASPVRQTDDWAGGEPKRSMPDSQFALDLLHEFARASTQLNHDASFRVAVLPDRQTDSEAILDS